MCLLFFPRLNLFLYASTEAILKKAVKRTWLRAEFAQEILVQEGDILRVDQKGRMKTEHFILNRQISRGFWDTFPSCMDAEGEVCYLEELKAAAGAFGYTPEDVERLFRCGWAPEEIEDALYSNCCL